MRSLRFGGPFWGALLLLLSPAAFAADLWVNPGTMGANALLVEPGDTARIPETVRLHLAGTHQRSARGDTSYAPYFRLESPIGRWASMISQGRPYEWWSVSGQTARDWDLKARSGSVGGDLSFGVKFLVFDGGPRAPSIALRNLTKSTTGKGYWDRRHTNAPAYLIDLLFSHQLVRTAPLTLELWCSAGFFAWQQGQNGQNDAPHWSFTLAALFNDGSLLKADFRGYDGWQTDDKPRVASLTGEWALGRHLALYAAAHYGFRDAPLLDAHLGLVLKLPAALPLTAPDPDA